MDGNTLNISAPVHRGQAENIVRISPKLWQLIEIDDLTLPVDPALRAPFCAWLIQCGAHIPQEIIDKPVWTMAPELAQVPAQPPPPAPADPPQGETPASDVPPEGKPPQESAPAVPTATEPPARPAASPAGPPIAPQVVNEVLDRERPRKGRGEQHGSRDRR